LSDRLRKNLANVGYDAQQLAAAERADLLRDQSQRAGFTGTGDEKTTNER